MAALDSMVAIVTGASWGIGRSAAIELAREGAAVTVAARTSARLDEVVREIEANDGRALAVTCDVTDVRQVDELVAATATHFGGVDILVNAAQSRVRDTSIETCSPTEWESALHSGLYGSLSVMRAALPFLKASGRGSIVNFGDPDAIVGEPGKVAMNVTKEAVRALSRTAAREWGRYGIRVNIVAPTARSERVADQLDGMPALESWLLTQIPGGELGDVVGVARTVVFLASPDSGLLTGMTVNVDGGRGMYA